MVTIVRKNDETFGLIVNDEQTPNLSLKQLFALTKKYHIEFDEVEMAIVDLVQNDNRVAEFGIQRRFMFSKK